MAVIFKCKMCGGTLNIVDSSTICNCEYCGTCQTIPQLDNEKKISMFNRANYLRTACEFDKAAGVYESIVTEFPKEAEAYWGLCLCKFGIEYVDDTAKGKKIPTCHRTLYKSIFDDSDFKQTLECADSVANSIYSSEAMEIDRLQKEIIEIAKNEQPFDVFICYKESDEKGSRTVDSELAHDIYDVLTEKGYKVFYSRITLKSKLGQDYEPYIFSALNSARVMLVIGTKNEYYNAVWVKNEWSRFLTLMSKDKEKVLIPCYRDIEAYDIPKEFTNLQAQDLGSPRAFQDLITNIEKIILPKEYHNKKEEAIVPNSEKIAEARLSIYNFQGKIAAGADFTVAIGSNKTVYATGNNYSGQCNVQDWKNLRQIAAGGFITAGLKEDGTVIAVGNGAYGNPDISGVKYWNNITKICVGINHIVALRNNGKTFSVGYDNVGQCDTLSWNNIIDIAAGADFTVGLKANGTVVIVGNMRNEFVDISSWKGIQSIAAGNTHIVGLYANGTVVATGKNDFGECDVDGWNNIVAVYACHNHTVGLKNDGTIVIAGKNLNKLTDSLCWENIVAVAINSKPAGHGDSYTHIVCLFEDGSMKSCGDNNEGQCNVSSWVIKGEKDYELEKQPYLGELESQRKAEEQQREEYCQAKEQERHEYEELRRLTEESARRKAEFRAQNVCQYCGGAFKGLFGKKCSVCGKPKDY